MGYLANSYSGAGRANASESYIFFLYFEYENMFNRRSDCSRNKTTKNVFYLCAYTYVSIYYIHNTLYCMYIYILCVCVIYRT